ncbi:MAG TPA: phosphoribosylanthranilate isomerase [Afifellaceae bacterium]|nr:phosphoribosylanthranilate isomerase [Afifellaceae bacterium]
MTTEIKICGLNDPEALETAIAEGADLAGMVFFPKSPRHVEFDAAAALAERARDRIRLVALTVDAGDALIDAVAGRVRPDMIQFHGRESPDRVREVAERTGLGTIKAVGVSGAADLARGDAYAGMCDRLLLDAKPPAGADRPGGLGEPFDWTVLEGYEPGVPWLLAGGLTPESVAGALAVSGAPGVDVSSGVESAPGVKDPALIRDFIRAVRRYDAEQAARQQQVRTSA